MRFRLLAGIALALTCATSIPAQAAPKITALATGRATYRVVINGQPRGEQILTIGRTARDRYRLTMDAPGVEQRWEAVVDTGFAPLEARLEMKTRAGPYKMVLRYHGTRVTGSGRKPVDDGVPRGIIDQRVDWAYVAAARLQRGARLAFKVYDPETGVSNAEARGLGRGWVEIAGRRTAVRSTAYRIVKASGPEDYVVHVAARGPAVMVREDMPHGLHIELLDFRAGSGLRGD